MDSDFCSSCAKSVSASVTINDSGQLVRSCTMCGTPIGGGVMTATVVRPAMHDKSDVAHRPVREAPAEHQASVTNLPAPKRAARPAAGASADDIVASARAQLAALDLEIPELEANLARAKAHRRGLAKMVAAYDKGAATVTPIDRARQA